MLSDADAALIKNPPEPRELDTLESYLKRLGLLGRGFEYGELVKRGSARHMPVPRALWRRTVAPLVLAIELRRRLIAATGAHGLRVAAFYRPAGGADHSLHKDAAAIDLDLLRVDRHLVGYFAKIAAELWRELEGLPVGAGTYGPEGSTRTRRVHLDFGLRHRCWQGTGRNAAGTTTWSARPAILRLAPRVQAHPLGEAIEVAATMDREREILVELERLDTAPREDAEVRDASPPAS